MNQACSLICRSFYFLLPSLLFSFYLHDFLRLRECSVSPGSQIPPPPPSLLHGGQLARNACTVLEYVCPPVTFDAMSGTLRYNCSSQQWSASDLTSCSGASDTNSTILQFVTDLIFYSEFVVSDAGICHSTLMCCHTYNYYNYAVSPFYTFSCWCWCHSWHDGPHWHRYSNTTIGITYYSHHTLLHGA